MTHILEDLPHKMEGQPPKKRSNWVYRYIYIYCILFFLQGIPVTKTNRLLCQVLLASRGNSHPKVVFAYRKRWDRVVGR